MNSNDLMTLTHFGERQTDYLRAVTPPIFLTSLHIFDTFEDCLSADIFGGDYFYGRSSNPTTRILEAKLAELEHGKNAVVFSSGMAAVTAAIMTICHMGSHILCLRDVYSPARHFIDQMCVAKLGMTVTYVTGQNLAELEAAVKPETDLIMLESPTSFVFSVVDLRAVADIAKRHGVKTYIDNTYCTPLFQKPLDLGIDVVMHTLTKYVGGHSDLLGGVLISKDEAFLRKLVLETREWFGGVIGPMEAWLAIRGLRTLDVRLQRHYQTAMAVAEFLEAHPKVKRVRYPGLKSHPQRDIIEKQQSGSCGLIGVELNGTPDEALAFVDHLKVFARGCSWGGFESLVYLPFYHCAQKEVAFLQAERGLIRLHCGLEGEDVLIEDLTQALSKL